MSEGLYYGLISFLGFLLSKRAAHIIATLGYAVLTPLEMKKALGCAKSRNFHTAIRSDYPPDIHQSWHCWFPHSAQAVSYEEITVLPRHLGPVNK